MLGESGKLWEGEMMLRVTLAKMERKTGGSKSVDRGDEVRLYCALDHGVDEGQKEA